MTRAERRRARHFRRGRHQLLAEQWARADHVLQLCANCGRHFQAGERIHAAEAHFAVGTVLFRLCLTCGPALDHDPALRVRLAREAYRSLFNAGPDDVAGNA